MTYNEIWVPNKGPSSNAGRKPDTDAITIVTRDPYPDCPADG